MTRHPFSTSPSYLQYIRGVRDIHALIKAGKDDSPEADAIRDSMDNPWYNLSETEQSRIRGLSADLYSISDPPQLTLESNPQVKRKLQEAFAATNEGKWDLALSILRRLSRRINPAKLSFHRGKIWDEAGDNATADLFYKHAAHLDPIHFEHPYLMNLWKIEPIAGQKFANEIIASPINHTAEIVITASGIIFMALRGVPVTECRLELEKLIPALEYSIARVRSRDLIFPGFEHSFETTSLILLSCCHERLSNKQLAITCVDEALLLSPYDVRFLVIRGIFRYGVELDGIDDFKLAIKLGSGEVWPRFYLAHYSLVTGEFEACASACEEALNYSSSNEVRSFLYEWLAISRSELGRPSGEVRDAFKEALHLASDPNRIQQNFEAFEHKLAHPHDHSLDWMKPNALIVKSFGSSQILPPITQFPIAA